MHAGWTPRGDSYKVLSGSARYRLPVSRANAFATAGAINGTGISPIPVGASALGTI